MRSLGRNDNLGDLDMENLYSWEILGKIVADIIVVKFCLVSKQYIELWLEMTLPETHSQFAHENGWDWKIKSPFLFWFRPIFRDELLVLGRVSWCILYNCYLVNSLDPNIAAIKVEHFLVG